jgi:hypothetical protein
MTEKSKKKTELDDLDLADGQEVQSEPVEDSSEAQEDSSGVLDDLTLADGKESDQIKEARELEELLGIDKVNPFGTTLPEIFEETLKEGALVDLQRLAEKAGVFAIANKTALKDRLRLAFRDFQRGQSVQSAFKSREVQVGDQQNPDLIDALKLMKQGL